MCLTTNMWTAYQGNWIHLKKKRYPRCEHKTPPEFHIVRRQAPPLHFHLTRSFWVSYDAQDTTYFWASYFVWYQSGRRVKPHGKCTYCYHWGEMTEVKEERSNPFIRSSGSSGVCDLWPLNSHPPTQIFQPVHPLPLIVLWNAWRLFFFLKKNKIYFQHIF